MRKSRFTEAQIIGMIKEQEAGMPTAEVCRRHGLSPATFYKLNEPPRACLRLVAVSYAAMSSVSSAA